MFPRHIETIQLICIENLLIGFYMMGTLVDNGLKKREKRKDKYKE